MYLDLKKKPMSKCSSCRKLEANLDSWWDKFRLWLFRFFHQDIEDLSQEKYIQGISDGYKIGYGHAKKNGHDMDSYENNLFDRSTRNHRGETGERSVTCSTGWQGDR